MRFFHEYLIAQRGMSPHTIRGYRDALLHLLQFIAADVKRPVERLDIADLSVDRVARFLNFLESVRRNGVATGNARLCAIA